MSHEWIPINGVEGYFCSADYCPRCGTARTGPHGGKEEGGRLLYSCEYRVGCTGPTEVSIDALTPCLGGAP